MSKENIELVNTIYRNFNDRRYDELVKDLSDDCEWVAADNSPLADRSPYHGIKAIREDVFGRIAVGFKRLDVNVDEMIDAGNKIVALGYYTGEMATGVAAPRAQLAHIWTFRDGKAVMFQQYVDTFAIARGLKTAPLVA
jgi:uncharacterized protein